MGRYYWILLTGSAVSLIAYHTSFYFEWASVLSQLFGFSVTTNAYMYFTARKTWQQTIAAGLMFMNLVNIVYILTPFPYIELFNMAVMAGVICYLFATEARQTAEKRGK